ncbi:uncharacterized protein LOC135469969 isoform X2 [Liolophura sinensis]|uniref:uncharacterized protein LOC135469969 isoform X2 n=1 Tax=Liolophura sinensis TaxID=3198878 RepID=UPI003158626F
MEWTDIYRVAGSEKVQDLEVELKKELDELKNELEENAMIHGIPSKPISSVPIPKSISHYRNDRKLIIERAMQVSEAQPLVVQADVMKEEMLATQKEEYTKNSIPLLLHQYFLDRIQQLVQCKHMHMLRWKRFSENTNFVESLYTLYHARLQHIMAEYRDCIERAQRLAVVKEGYLSHTDQGIQAVKEEDLLIYLRWLVCHLHSVKMFNQYLRVLQWLPVTRKMDFAVKERDREEEASLSSRMASRYQDDSLFVSQSFSADSRRGSATSSLILNNVPPVPPPISSTLLTVVPMTSSSFIHASAAAGGGVAGDEELLQLPLHVNEFEKLRQVLSFLLSIYGISYDVQNVTTSAEEMEIYSMVNKKFRQIFGRQEHMKTFRTYDTFEAGQENWGADTFLHALKKEANWQEFVRLKPEKDAHQEKQMTQLRHRKKIDELLRVQSHFLQVMDAEHVLKALKEHAALVRDPPGVQAASVTANKTPYNTATIMKRIYSNPDFFSLGEKSEDAKVQEIDERDIENVNLSRSSSVTSGWGKRKDSYSYFNSVQMLGLDEGDQECSDPATIQGAYMSYLLLRHLRIRDLQRTCLSVFNYFRSVERTLTINDGGLSMEADKATQASKQNHRKGTEVDGTTGGGGGLGYHGYLHNTPLDFKMSETEFMEFCDIQNHDDFYLWEEGRVHVQDQQGYYIVYDAAMNDLKALENDLLLLASYFIDKDRDLRTASGIKRSSLSSFRRRQSVAGDTDLSSYAHQEVDRIAILMDIWTNETAFMECKKELLDCYLEAYQHVFDRDEKRALAQVITNIIHQRPRIDFKDKYFIKTYRTECVTLRLHCKLLKSILDKQIEEQREYAQRVCREGDGEFGLPHKVIPKQPVSINMSSHKEEEVPRSALKNVFLMEFHPSLAISSRLPEALKYAYGELVHMHRPESTYEMVMLERNLLEVCLKEWEKLPVMGRSYSPHIQKDLFSDVFVEDPLFICEIAVSQWHQEEKTMGRCSLKEKQLSMISTICRMMEVVTSRYRLMDAAWETEILSKVYRKQAVELGFEDYHLFLRFVQFEFASFKEDAGKPPPVFLTAVHEEDPSVDRYTPSFLYLAIQELDENHVGRFSFRGRDGLLQVYRPGGLENLQVILKAQVVHKNCLICAVQQVSACQPVKGIVGDRKSGRATPTETKSEKSTLTQMTGFSSGTQGTALASKRGVDSKSRDKTIESFISIQLEKGPSRDLMLNEFVKKKAAMGVALRNTEEMEKVKRNLISNYCEEFFMRMAQYSLRSQILMYHYSMLALLDQFPSIRDTYFMVGEANEKKTAEDSMEGMESEPGQMKKRPRRLLSADGKHLLNLWFIPHHTEVLVMFKTLDDHACVRALTHSLCIVSSLHDILQYLCAHSSLGSSHARFGSQKMEFVSADWGGNEGIGAELREIQKQINNLPEMHEPEIVGDFLALRRDVMFLEIDTAVRHSMIDTFLHTGNVQAFKAISDNIYSALPTLSNVQRPSLFSTYLNIPEPLEARDAKASLLFPWRAFCGRNGPFPTLFWPFHQIEHNIQLAMAGLKDVDRHVANGELLGVVLLMEDVLLAGIQDASALGHDGDGEGSQKSSPASSRPVSRLSKDMPRPTMRLSQDQTKKTAVPPPKQGLSRTHEPLEAYRLLRSFLLLWKRQEVLKADWGRRKLIVERIESPHLYKEFCKQYKLEILFPVIQSVARRLGQGDLYEGLVSESEPLVMPKGSSEIEIRSRQVFKLLENLECHMINEVRKKLARELTLALAERSREEGALPTDLWKKPVMKESYTITRPHIAENFAQALMSDCLETEEDITISKAHLNTCLTELAQRVMAREKLNYESYTMYYETLLKANHNLLYQKEQEMKQLQDQVKSAVHNVTVEVQCQMADQAHDILMEITALRAKISEMRDMSLTQERDIRERVKEEYEGLVQNLFNTVCQVKAKFDEYRGDLLNDTREKIAETRSEAVEALTKLNQKFDIKSDNTSLVSNLAKADHMRNVQRENHHLNVLILKMKTMNSWRQNHSQVNFTTTIGKLKKEADKIKKQYVEMKMIAEEEVILLRQQQVAIRKALTSAEKELNEVKKMLEKELKVKQEKSHVDLQRARSQRQLQSAKSANIEKLLEELGDKDMRLRLMSNEQDKQFKLSTMNQGKVKKDMTQFKKQLAHERSLKLDAFNRVDELQAQIYDYETVQRSHSAVSLPSSSVSRVASTRSQSAKVTSSKSTRPSTASTGVWPPRVVWPQNRSVTPELGSNTNLEVKKIQRPKTVSGRLRSRIAEKLLYELEREERINVQLQQLHLENISEKNL